MNIMKISGTVLDNPSYDHTFYGKRFYKTFVATKRNSGVSDVLPCIIPEKFVGKLYAGTKISISGSVRTFCSETTANRLNIYVFVNEIEEYPGIDENFFFAEGYLHSKNHSRKTPLGRVISDFTISSKRIHEKSDCIPCVCWGNESAKMDSLTSGVYISVLGRLQSREYLKKYPDGTKEERIAYEVSSFNFGIIKEEEKCQEQK